MADYTTAPPGQDGYASFGFSWDDVDPTLVASTGISAYIGLVFAALQIEIESASISLKLAASSQTPASAVLQLWFVPELAPADYGLAALPTTRSEVLISELLYTGQPVGTVLTFTIGQTHIPANQAQVDAATAQLLAISSMVSWTGRLAFTVKALTGSFMHFESSEAATAPLLSVVEVIAAEEASSLAHVAKQLRQLLIAKLNADTTLSLLNLDFQDMVGRAVEDLDRNERRGYVGTHPEEAEQEAVPHVRNLEITIAIAVGAKGPMEASDQLDDAQEAVEQVIDSEPTLGGLAPGWMTFVRAHQWVDSEGRRDYGTRALVYRARYARREA